MRELDKTMYFRAKLGTLETARLLRGGFRGVNMQMQNQVKNH
jgi:hypothetical protein